MGPFVTTVSGQEPAKSGGYEALNTKSLDSLSQGQFDRVLRQQDNASTEQAPKTRFVVTLQDYLEKAGLHPAVNVSNVSSAMPTTALPAANSRALKSLNELSPEIQQAIKDAEQKYGVSEKMIRAIVRNESNFNPNAVSHCGAQGLMQLMPQTARGLGVTNAFDIKQNIDAGVRYFKQMLDKFGGDHRMALAAYNAGPGAVAKYGGIPPYKETQNYVVKILKDYNTPEIKA